jgi:hypothetical protein
MSKLVLVILAEQQRFEPLIRNPIKQRFSLVLRSQMLETLKSLFPETHIRGGFPVIFGRP